MALQTQNLVMVGLGTLGDEPPNDVQPQLVDGIHLRWAFKPELGFPWYGFYLFRRTHRCGRLLRLSDFMGHLEEGPWPRKHIGIPPHGHFISYNNLRLTNEFHSPNAIEFSQNLRFTFRPDEPVRRIQLRIGFRQEATIHVKALWEEMPLGPPLKLLGQAGQILISSLEFDAISAVKLTGGPAALVDLRFVPVAQEFTEGWELVPEFDYPLRLPVTRPHYPCTRGANENLTQARFLAARRIRYGTPNYFTSPADQIHHAGTVSIAQGSSVVVGHGTNWSAAATGGVFQVDGDETAYTVTAFVGPEKLVLSRGYAGPQRDGETYAINLKDHFGQLHDYLVHLVAGGNDAGAMVNRSLPRPAYSAGTITFHGNPADTASGIGTGWTADLEGLSLQVARHTAGEIEVEAGSPIVEGHGTNWGDHLAHMTLHVAGQPTLYPVLEVESPTRLVLDRHYTGISGASNDYTFFDSTAYTINNVDPAGQQLTLDRDYAQPFNNPRTYRITCRLQPADSRRAAPLMPRQYPLDLVLLAALHPAVAQMVGLYWVDETVDPDEPYDYLLLAANTRPSDDTSTLIPTGEQFLVSLNQGRIGFDEIDGYIVFNKQKEPAQPLPAPTGLQVYALPGSTRSRDGVVFDASNNAGLCWNLGTTREGILRPNRAIMYHLWRANLGNEEEPAPPGEYDLITTSGPRLVVESHLPEDKSPHRPPNWPNSPLHAIDSGPVEVKNEADYQVNGLDVYTGLPDGWYSYQVSGIDIFGRHSSNSAAGTWHQWAPAPDPPPWYYQDLADDGEVHPFAVRLLDKMPPPPPTGIEAFALDPLDGTVLQDGAYNAWRAGNEEVVGLRVHWLWTLAHMQQAPDTSEFRIYYQPRRLNALLGRVVIVTDVSSTESLVETDISNLHSESAYVGARLQVGSDAFLIVASDDGSPLCLHARHHRSSQAVGTVSVENNSPIVKGRNTNWRNDLVGRGLQVADEASVYTILQVKGHRQLILDRPYDGDSAEKQIYWIIKLPRANALCTLTFPPDHTAGRIAVGHDSRTVTGTATGWSVELIGLTLKVLEEPTGYTVEGIDPDTQHLTLDREYEGDDGCDKAYVIRHPLFVDYGVAAHWQQRIHVVGIDDFVREFIPPAKDPRGYPLLGSTGTVNDSVVALAGNPDLSGVRKENEHLFLENDIVRPHKVYRITAVDNDAKEVTVDGTPDIGAWPSPWIIGLNQPLRQYEVFLPAPDAGEEGQSFFPSLAEPVVYAHIGISATDDKVHTLDDRQRDDGDWGGRPGNEGRVGAPAKIFRVRRQPLEPPIPPPDSEKVYATAADYHGRSFYTYRWQSVSHLKTHIFRALDDTLFKVDWSQRPRIQGQQLDSSQTELFPDEETEPRWDQDKRDRIADELNLLDNFDDEEAAKAYYRQLSNDALRVLAGLPGNERAFTQITIQPLDPEERDPENPDGLRWRNRLGPDNLPDFVVDPTLCAYVDTLDGRSTNRYFYRAAYVDGAHNHSPLSLSSPPAYLPDVLPPAKPRVLKVVGGDRRVTLQWAAHRDPAMRRSLVYRTDRKEDGRDIRLMGKAAADLPAEALIAVGAEVDLGEDTDIAMVERVYAAEGFDPSIDLLSGQRAEQYLAAPTAPTGTRVTGLSAPDDTPVVVVYRDSREGLQYTPWGNVRRVWTDQGLIGAHTYYYRIIATREVEDASGQVILRSLSSDLVTSRAVDMVSPEPPTWNQAEWVTREDGETVVRLVWSVREPGMQCIVQRKSADEMSWRAMSEWLTEPLDPHDELVYRFDDETARPRKGYGYRVKVINRAGNANVSFNTIYVPASEE